jgi:hypothetical protein
MKRGEMENWSTGGMVSNWRNNFEARSKNTRLLYHAELWVRLFATMLSNHLILRFSNTPVLQYSIFEGMFYVW